MYAFTSSGSRKWLHAIVITSVIGAILLYSISGAENVRYEWSLQLGAIILAAVGVYLTVRYSLREYKYELVDSGLIDAEGEIVYELSVTQVTGRRMVLAARANLRDVRKVKVLTRAQFKQEKTALLDGKTLIRCENDPFLSPSCYISVPSEHVVIAIPADPGMVKYLEAAARAPHPACDEEDDDPDNEPPRDDT